MHRRHRLGMCLALFTAAATAVAEDMSVNRLLASQCAQCHGTNGYAVGDMDGLHDEDFKDLVEDLLDMQGEDRPDDIMDHQALGYREDQVRRIARYFAMRSGATGEGGAEEGDEGDDEAGEREREREKEAQEAKSEREKKTRERRKEQRKKQKEKRRRGDDD